MTISQQVKERVLTEPAKFVEGEIKAFVNTSPANRLSFIKNHIIFDEPLVKFADGDDPIFTEYKSIIAPTHLTPHEALAKAYDKSPEDMPARLSVISWILPINGNTRESNRSQTLLPSRLWSHTRWYGEQFNDAMRKYVQELLREMGYLAVAPPLQPYFETETNEKGPYSNWSERHIAYAAGQGTFSLSDGFITERGIAHRCGSVVTDLILPASHRTAETPYSNCLFYVDGSCKACIARCPAGAITEEGHNKIQCEAYLNCLIYSAAALGDYLRRLAYSASTLKDGYDNDVSVIGCGLCQTKVSCEFRIPAKIGKKKRE